MLLLARTTPLEEVEKQDGRDLGVSGRHAGGGAGAEDPADRDDDEPRDDGGFLDDVEVPADALVGEEGKGFRYILDGMNAERILIAAECIGDGRWFIEKAARYASERVVFGRPIGANQGVQFPIARAHAAVEAADLVRYRAARLFDAGRRCGAEANMAKLLASEASWQAANVASTRTAVSASPPSTTWSGSSGRRASIRSRRLEQPGARIPRRARTWAAPFVLIQRRDGRSFRAQCGAFGRSARQTAADAGFDESPRTVHPARDVRKAGDDSWYEFAFAAILFRSGCRRSRLRAVSSALRRGRMGERVEPRERVSFKDAGVPALATIGALPELAVGQAGEQASVRGQEPVRHGRERLRKAACERAPRTVAPGIDACLGIPGAVGGERSRARGDEPRVRIVRRDRHRPRVVAIAAGVRGLPLSPPSSLHAAPPPPASYARPLAGDAMRASGRRAARRGDGPATRRRRQLERISPPSSIPTSRRSASCGLGAIQRTCEVHGRGGKLQVGREGSSSRAVSSRQLAP